MKERNVVSELTMISDGRMDGWTDGRATEKFALFRPKFFSIQNLCKLCSRILIGSNLKKQNTHTHTQQKLFIVKAEKSNEEKKEFKFFGELFN